jgi:hypothetical protein
MHIYLIEIVNNIHLAIFKAEFLSFQVSRYLRQESAAYVSAAIEVLQLKFIAHFFCKAPMAGK